MVKNNSPKIGHNKKALLTYPVEHIDIKSFDARKIIDGMSKMSFTSRDTARAAGIYNEMLGDKDCSIFLTLAGSLEVKDILLIPSIIFLASKDFMSICSTGLLRSVFLLCPILGLLFLPIKLLKSQPYLLILHE